MQYISPFELKPATPLSGAVDLAASEDGKILPGKRLWIPTGLYLKLLPGKVGLIKSRSGLAGRGLDTGAGVIDADYTGHVKVLLINNSDDEFVFTAGTRIAQLIITNHEDYSQLVHVTEFPLDETNLRGEKGFGSTGV